MSQVAATQIPKPRDEQAFERASVVLFKGLLNDPNVQTNGRRGQGQKGVDIFGFRNQDAAHPVGVQCKLKGPDAVLTEREVRDEVEEALKFVPLLREYTIVTTAPDDAKLQRIARELTIEAADGGRQIAINVWGWQTLEQRINEHGPAMQAFDPSYGPFAKQQSAQIDKIFDQQSIVAAELGQVSQQITGIVTASNLPGGSTVVQNALEAALDAEIDQYRDVLNGGKSKTALGLYDALLSRIRNSASGRILFRVKANIGHCHLLLGDNVRAAHWLAEAFAHAPAEPKAIANKALSMLLLEKYREAYEYGLNELKIDPANQWLANYVVQAVTRCPDLDDPLSKIPEPLRELDDVQAAYVDFLRHRNRTPDWWTAARKASAAHPDHKMLWQHKAEADLDEVGQSPEFQRGSRLSPDTRAKIEGAAKILLARWDQRRLSESPAQPDGVVACCNLLAAYFALGETAAALAVAKQAILLVPDDKNLLERAAIAALEAHDYGLTETLLPKLTESSNATLVRFQFYAHTNNWPKLIEVAKQSELVLEHERVPMTTMGRLAALMSAGGKRQDQHDELKRILEAANGNVRAYVLVSEFATRLGHQDVGDEAYNRALTTVEKEAHLFGRQMLARLASRRGDWRAVVRLLDGHIDTYADSDELSLLATAFVNENPTRRRALSFFKELDPSIRNQPHYAIAYGLLESKRGDLAAAEKALEEVLSTDPKNLTALRNLFAVYLRQERSDRVQLIQARIRDLDLKTLEGSAQDKLALTHILRDVGEGKRALEWAYEIVQSNRNDPDLALGYFGLIIAHGDAIEIPKTTEVAVDAWVKLKNNLGEQQNVLIENGPDRPADGFYSPSHPFIAPALGLKVGESFTHARQFGKPETWTILEIKHKYLHALHDIMDTFNVRFPEAKGLHRVTTEGEDISPILDEVKTHSERSRAIADLYLEKKIPLAFIAAMTHTEVIKFASGITQFGREITTCYGNEAERSAAESLVVSHANKGAVLDCYAAWTAEAIGILPALQKLFGTLFVPRSAIDELSAIQHEFGGAPGRMMTMEYHDGQYFREEMTAMQVDARGKAFAERRRTIEQYCEIVPVDVPDGASDLACGLIEQSGSHVLDAAFLAFEKDTLLLCEDLYFRQIALQACRAKGTYLQAAVTVAAAKGIIDSPALANATVGLASLRHAHVALSPATLFEVAKQDNTDRQQKYGAVAEFIGTESAEINSHVRVTIVFLIQVWDLAITDNVKRACSGIMIERLLRFRKTDYLQIIGAIRSQLAGHRRASEYLESWIKGHFIDI
jgi:cellulose synthase operon protein C